MATNRIANDRIPLMLIHGAWLSARSWENFADYFGKRGFAVSAPEWPRKEGDVEELREEAEELRGLGITEIVDHFEERIRALDEPPVLIGHSFGGLIVELLLDRGLGRAGVAISPAPPKGILVLPFSSLKAAAPALVHPSKRNGIVTLTLEEFTYGFVNTFSPEEPRRHTSATPSRRRAGSSTKPASPTSTSTRRRRFTSRTASVRRSSSSAWARTTPSRPRSPGSNTRSTSARRRRRSSSSSRVGLIWPWLPPDGTRSQARSTAGLTACSRLCPYPKTACPPKRAERAPERSWTSS